MEIEIPEAFRPLYVVNRERPVVKIPHPVLRQVAREVPKVGPSVGKLIDTMIRAMEQAHGIGLAAPQMAISQRVLVMHTESRRPIALVNPVITEREGEIVGEEGCLSIPGLYGDVTRSRRVLVQGLDKRGKPVEYEMEGLSARVVQHEIDHLDGILFIDHVHPDTLHWSMPSHERDAE